MTTRKYKKLLMSEGLDRNLAERERKTAARVLSWNKSSGGSLMERYVDTVNSYRCGLGLNYRTYQKNIHLILRSAVIV